jgi:enamine deaminase RidA (YjgF/YER057c/UK114 family)
MARFRAIAASETCELRRAILHPGQDDDELLSFADHDPVALHVGAFDGDRLVGIGSIRPEALPHSCYPVAWRIVGMAVAQSFRRRGFGGEILGRLLGHAATQGGKLAWCNSRVAAASLYRRYGFTSTPHEVDTVAPRIRMTSRLDRTAPLRRGDADPSADIRRIDTFPRLSRAVVFNGIVHVGGLLPNRADVPVGEQTREILEQIDTLLERAGTSRTRLVSATVWLKDIATAPEANAVWEAWVPTGAAPARACVQAVPGSADFGIEIAVIAAL